MMRVMTEPISATDEDQGEPVAAPALQRLLPFAADDAGIGYFRSDYHHRFLVAALLRQLAQGRSFLLLGGEPGADGELLERFLNEERGGRHRASLVRCRPGMAFADVVRAYSRQLGLRQEADGAGIWTLLSHLMIEARNGVTRILILEHAEALERDSFDELLGFTQLDQPHVMPVVLLASSDSVGGPEAPHLAFLQSVITGRVPVDRLEPEEVDAFIRYQLNALPQEDGTLLPPETVRAIAAAAGGSAAAVNRLARQAVDGAASITLQRPPILPPAPPPAAETEIEPLALVAPLPEAEPVPRRRWRLPAGAALGVYVAMVALSGFGLLYLLVPRAPHTAPAAALSVPSPAADGGQVAAAPAAEPPLAGASVAAAPPAPEPDPVAARLAAIEPAAADPAVPTQEAAAPESEATEPPAAEPVAATPPAPAVATAEPAEAKAAPEPVAATPAASQTAAVEPLPAEPPAASEPAPSVPPSQAVQAPPSPLPEPAPSPPSIAVPDAGTALMVRRGEQLLAAGDIIPARRFFERAAADGDAAAACGLGKSYDPLFLRRLRVVGPVGDAAAAIAWYRRAAAAGSADARTRLERLEAANSGGTR